MFSKLSFLSLKNPSALVGLPLFFSLLHFVFLLFEPPSLHIVVPSLSVIISPLFYLFPFFTGPTKFDFHTLCVLYFLLFTLLTLPFITNPSHLTFSSRGHFVPPFPPHYPTPPTNFSVLYSAAPSLHLTITLSTFFFQNLPPTTLSFCTPLFTIHSRCYRKRKLKSYIFKFFLL